MSNIAGKAYAINVVTPVRIRGRINRIIFWFVRHILKGRLDGLVTLSLIHYARWVIIGPDQFPRLSPEQPKENLRYAYEFFFSNFNGSWNQYIDSFSMAIDSGLDLLWWANIGYPNAIPIDPFHRYIHRNQIDTDHYSSAYPLASCNDVKAAQRVRNELLALTESTSDEFVFGRAYAEALVRLQHDLGPMNETPIVSLANIAVVERQRAQAAQADLVTGSRSQ